MCPWHFGGTAHEGAVGFCLVFTFVFRHSTQGDHGSMCYCHWYCTKHGLKRGIVLAGFNCPQSAKSHSCKYRLQQLACVCVTRGLRITHLLSFTRLELPPSRNKCTLAFSYHKLQSRTCFVKTSTFSIDQGLNHPSLTTARVWPGCVPARVCTAAICPLDFSVSQRSD